MQFIIVSHKSDYSQLLSMLDSVQQHNDLQEGDKQKTSEVSRETFK